MARVTKNDVNLLPHDAQAEEALIGAILIDPDALIRAREVDLQAGDFYREIYGLIYASALEIASRFEPVDHISLSHALSAKQNGQGSLLDMIGGQPELARLIETVESTVYAKHYAELIKRESQRRRLISAAGDMAVMVHEHEGSIEELFDKASHRLFEAMDRLEIGSHLYGTDETLEQYLARQLERKEAHARRPSHLIKTHLPDLDRLLGHIAPGSLHIVGAITSIGKTIYMEQIAEANAMRGHHVAYYHLELQHERMEDRRMARHSGIPMRKLNEEGYNGPEVSRAIDSIRSWHDKLIYVHCPGWSADRIVADMVRLHARGECELAIVDYLEKIPLPEKRGRNEASLIGEKVELLKTMAEKLKVAVVLGCQVSRDYKQMKRRPRLDDLRGSAEIEQKANQVVMLHRPAAREGGDHFNERELIEAYVDKNEGGATGKADLWHRMGRYRLECLEPQHRLERQREIEEIPL